MAKRLKTLSKDICPLTDVEVLMDLCQPCDYFRGAASYPGEGRRWTVLCNYPRNGSAVAVEKPGWDIPIPDYIRDAFAGDPE